MPNCNKNKIAWNNWYNRNDVMLILYEMLHTCSIMHTQRKCKFENTANTDASGCFFTNVTFTAVAEIGIIGEFCEKLSYIQLVFRSSNLILNWRAYTFLLHIHVKYEYRIPFMIWKLQTTFSNVSSMKVFEFRLQFHWSLFPRVQLIVSQHWFR